MNVLIYIFSEVEYAKFTWQFFPPLFEFPGQPQPPTYMTIYMSPDGKFYQIKAENVPKANGILGNFLETLEATATCDIELPKQLLNISKSKKDEMIRRGSMTSLRKACTLLGNTLGLDSAEEEDSNNDKNGNDIRERLPDLLQNSEEDFSLYCQILIKCNDFKALEVGISDWDTFVAECEHTRRFMTLSELDHVIVERNIEVGSLVRACNEGGEELDKRRKTVNRTVIASSTVGLVSGGLAITGLVLAPFSFGASLGLSIVGGAIGVAAGATSGGARTVEAVKQNTKMKDIKGKLTVVEKLETDISGKLETANELFSNAIPALDRVPQERPGISRRGFLAVGSAVRSFHSGVGIALAAARLSATAATVSVAILGPLSLVLDIAFLAEAIDRTNAGKKLKDIAATVDVKHRVFNSMLRGNCFDLERLVVIENI